MGEAAPRRTGRVRGLGLACILLLACCAVAQTAVAAPQAPNPAPPAASVPQAAAAPAGSAIAAASPFRGVVTFGGLPLPGATVTATQGTTTKTAISDVDGTFQFDDLADGKWTIDIQMQAFAPLHAEVTIAPSLPAAAYELKLLSPDQIQASAQTAKPVAEAPPSAPTAAQSQQPQPPQGKKPAQANAPTEIPKAPEENEQSADGLLVQGSVNNAATSQYATNAAFGNTRSGSKALYTGGFQVNESNSALNAQPYALSGSPTTKPSFNLFTGVAALQGPFKIPHLLPRGPNFFLAYVWTRNSVSQILTGLVPTPAEQSGDLSKLTNAAGQPVTVYQPGTSTPYTNNQVPVSAQAAYLMSHFYKPLVPNVTASSAYNYQAPVLNNTHVDALQSRFDKSVGRKDSFNGRFAFQSIRSDSVNLFGFVDETGTLGMTTNVQWSHRLKPRVFLYTNFSFGRNRTEVTPYFANRQNVSGAAGVTGNNQDAINWGPPTLSFQDGTAGLSDANSSFNRGRSDDLSVSTLIYRGKHNIKAGVEFNKREYNDDFQQNPRGTFNFNGLATASGSALADFLIGVPDGSAIAYGNANKYFREPVYNAYINDDWRVMPILTINAGLRWDYGAPITELFGNLVNLDVSSDFTSVKPVEGSSVSGTNYPAALIRPDRRMIEPLIGATWRPIPASTVVIKAGYGLYPDTSVYQNIVLNMAQQYPLSTSLSVANSTTCQLTLASGFPAAVTANGLRLFQNHSGHIRHRPQLSCWLLTDLAGVGAARSALCVAGNGYLPRLQRLARSPGDSAQQLSARHDEPESGLSSGICLRDIQRQFYPRGRAIPVAAQVAQRLCRLPRVHLFEVDRRRCLSRRRGPSNLERRLIAIGVVVVPFGGHRPELARPKGGAFALELRSAPALERDGAIHQRPGTGRRHLAGRLARSSVEGVDGAGQFDLWIRIAGDACLPAHGFWHGFCDRPSATNRHADL